MNKFQNNNAHVDGLPPTLSSLLLSSFRIRKKKRNRQNIIHRLFDRQYNPTPRIHPFVINNKLHQNLVPNFSIENTQRPNCYLRKFTYDGRYLMAFSSDITSVELYEYQGPAAAAKLLSQVSSNQDYLSYRGEENAEIRRDIFNCFFKHKHSIKVTANGDQLNRECNLFTEDNCYLIVASTSFTNEISTPYHDRYQNNESIPIGTHVVLEDYSFHIIDLDKGKVLDKIHFKTDKIFIAYNHGVYLYKNIFAILSVQHQTIYLYYILPNGQFIFNQKIGRFCIEEDRYFFEDSQTHGRISARNKPVSPFREVPFNSLKHRLLVFAFKLAKRQSEEKKSPKPLCDFYRDFDLYANLRMWKMQLLDDEHILIKYEQENTLINKAETGNFIKHWNLFAIYNWKTTQILNIYPQYSETLLHAYENFCDYFRHPLRYSCSPSNNYHARVIYDEFKRSIFETKNGSYKEAIRYILSLIPHHAQSLTSSPYLDLSLFSYDEKLICSNEKPRYTSEVPLRFYNRDTGRLLFRLHTGQAFIPFQNPHHRFHQSPQRRLIAYIFHPVDPFIISVQRNSSHYFLHFHIRHNNPT